MVSVQRSGVFHIPRLGDPQEGEPWGSVVCSHRLVGAEIGQIVLPLPEGGVPGSGGTAHQIASLWLRAERSAPSRES